MNKLCERKIKSFEKCCQACDGELEERLRQHREDAKHLEFLLNELNNLAEQVSKDGVSDLLSYCESQCGGCGCGGGCGDDFNIKPYLRGLVKIVAKGCGFRKKAGVFQRYAPSAKA